MEVAKMFNQRLSAKKKVRLLVALTILAWATQTLLSQWGFGQEAAHETPPAPTEERFVPTRVAGPSAVLELRSEATVIGQEITLRQIARWDDRDKPMFDPVADLVVARVGPKEPFRSIKLDDLKQLLYDAGVNLGSIRFSGAMACTVTRSDVEFDERRALEQWALAKGAVQPEAPEVVDANRGEIAITDAPEAIPHQTTQPAEEETHAEPTRTLKQLLLADLCQRLQIPADAVQLSFSKRDEKLLYLAEPQFGFVLTPKRVRNLGPVSWQVEISARNGIETQKVTIDAHARMWQHQIVTARAVNFGQILRAEDLEEARVLVDRLPEDKLITREQAVHHSAARQLPAGTVLTAKMVEAVPLVRRGQFVTITLKRGTVLIRTVARAMESGGYGQAIKVKNEATRDIYEVVITGPQEAQFGPIDPVATVE
jgi:flagella basal body P-ring formation protein FlgA